MHNEQHDLNLELLITLVETPPHNNQAVTKLMYSKYLVSFILELFPPLIELYPFYSQDYQVV